jgi:signal peptidase II
MVPLVIAIFITVLDQVTKEWVRAHFATVGDVIPVIPGFFNLTYVQNTGAAWGIFSGHNHWLSLFSIIMLFVMVVFRRSFLNDTWDHRIALGLMIGGILGNFFDRVRLEFVTDFLDFYVGSSHWPSFNVADSAICVGVGIYILSAFWAQKHPLKTDAGGQKPETCSGPTADPAPTPDT